MMHRVFLEMKATEHRENKNTLGDLLRLSMSQTRLIVSCGGELKEQLAQEKRYRRAAIHQVKRGDAVQAERNRLTR
jgi:hypothetical protein